MIQNTLVSTTDYADLWCHLKSMNHALRRAMDEGTNVAELDIERLCALEYFLSNHCISFQPPPKEFLTMIEDNLRSFTPDIDIRKCFRELPEFEEWLSKTGFETKINRLIKAIKDYVDSAKKGLFVVKNTPPKEFSILRALLSKLITQTQSTMYI